MKPTIVFPINQRLFLSMKEVDFLAVGDLHLMGLRSLFGPLGDDYILRSVDKALSYARSNNIKAIIVLGDIFDNPHPTKDVMVKLLTYFYSNKDLNFYMILGNHDIENTEIHSLPLFEFLSQSQLLPNLKVYTVPTFERVENIPFCFLPWPHIKLIETKTKRPSITCNIAHIALKGAKANNGRPLTEGFSLKTNKDYWIIGDLHAYQKYNKKIIYPGTMFQKNFGEGLPKGFLHVTATLSKTKELVGMVWRFKPIDPVFLLENLKIESLEDLEKVEYNKKSVKLYKLFVSADCVLPQDLLTKYPNIVSVRGYKSVVDLSQIMSDNELLVDSEKIEFNQKNLVFIGLDDFLKANGLTTKKIKKAQKIVASLLKEV